MTGSLPRPPRHVLCMSLQAKGELRAARAEIDELKEDKAVLGKTLDNKAKEFRMQLLQVIAVVVGDTWIFDATKMLYGMWPLPCRPRSACRLLSQKPFLFCQIGDTNTQPDTQQTKSEMSRLFFDSLRVRAHSLR